MPWANPFQRMIEEVIRLTEPPSDVVVPPGPEAIAVGLLMRERMLLRAEAFLADRIFAGANDPLIRAILEASFTAGWLLADPDAYETYLGHHRRKWRVIAEEQHHKIAPIDPEVRAELEYFLDRGNKELPAEAEVPSFKEQAQAAGLSNFYGLYRMTTRRAHPDLDAARTGLVETGDGMFQPNASPLSAALGEVFVKMGIYLVARIGQQVDNRLGWGKADELRDLVSSLDEEGRRGIEDAVGRLAEAQPLPDADPETVVGPNGV